ncbi:DUF742 domain-containing protein [Actinomadura sp. NPDC049382]|uniref:DUF742 domain-containing protein n=1 Tax=Actinomadura sp. NPDC049382 TaxID=3158220 RepID=UPI0034390074
MSNGLNLERLNALLEASSLGDPAAAKLRKRTPRDLAEAAVQRAGLRTGPADPAPEQRVVDQRARTRQQLDLGVHDRGGADEAEGPSEVGQPAYGASASASGPSMTAVQDDFRSLVAAGDSAAYSLVRPYAVTGGRLNRRANLAVEALVTAVPNPPRDVSTLTPEYRAIMDLCRSAHSVAEVSAMLSIPLQIARALTADMVLEGFLRLHQSGTSGTQPDLGLLERVLNGLRKL